MSAADSATSASGTPEDWPASVDPQSVEGLFLAALQATPAEREAYLQSACAGDEDRLRRVRALLRAYADAGSFLETPPGHAAAGGASDSIRLDFLTPTDKPGCLGKLGPYEVIDVIGRGGMGIVLRALDPKLNRIVAVKVLAPELAINPNARKRFLREAQAAAAISHPHVVTIHAVEEGVDPQLPYLVMECVVGQSLQEKLDRVGALSVTEILRISHQIACGLAAAHQQGLIHRDIKPANILLENGVERVKITDFGLARLVNDVAITRTGEVSGTPQYMSPEQAKGERVDPRSDLFSLGCVMYAMCTGHSPFRGDSLAHVIQRVTQDDPRPIEDQNPDIPPWMIEIISQLLAKHPDARIQSAEEVEQMLQEHLSLGPSKGRRTEYRSPAPPTRRAVDRQHQPPNATAGLWLSAGRRVMLVALALLVLPWLFILIGGLLPDGDLMEFGGGLFTGGAPIAVLTLIVGGVLWFVGWLKGAGAREASASASGSKDFPGGQQSWLTLPWWTALAVLAVPAAAWAVLALIDELQAWGHWGPGRLVPREAFLLFWSAVLICCAAVYGVWRLLRRQDGDSRPWTQRAHEALGQPGKILTWLLIVLVTLVLVAPCVIGIGLGIPWYLSRQATVTVAIRYDPTLPIMEILTPNGTTHRVEERQPFYLELPPGRSELTVRYAHQGIGHEFKKVLNLQPSGGRTIEQDFSKDVLLDWTRHAAGSAPAGASSAEGMAESPFGMNPYAGPTAGSEGGEMASSPPGMGSDPFAGSSMTQSAPAHSAEAVASTLPAGVSWTVNDQVLSHREGKVSVTVRVLSEGMLVALRRKSLFDGRIDTEEKLITRVGDSQLTLQPGEYEILVRDEQFGWGQDGRGTITVRESGWGTLQVERELRSVLLADPSPLAEAAVFRWNGVGYAGWTRPRRNVLLVLANAELEGHRDVAESLLLQAANDPDSPLKRVNRPEAVGGAVTYAPELRLIPRESDPNAPQRSLEQAFNNEWRHPAWGKLVVPGEKTGTYRLAPLDQGTIAFTLPEAMESVTINYPRGAGSLTFRDHEPHVLTVQSGEFDVSFVPRNPDVAWMMPRGGLRESSNYESLPVRRTLKVQPGERAEPVFEYSLADWIEPQPSTRRSPNESMWEYHFRWYGHDNSGQSANPAPKGAYSLDVQQAACIGRLLAALVSGQPDVSESELLSVANQRPVPDPRFTRRGPLERGAIFKQPTKLGELFPGLPDQGWQNLLAPGETPGTWRLKAPQAATESEAAPSPDAASPAATDQESD